MKNIYFTFFLIWVFVIVCLVKRWKWFGVLEHVVAVLGVGVALHHVAVDVGDGICQNQKWRCKLGEQEQCGCVAGSCVVQWILKRGNWD